MTDGNQVAGNAAQVYEAEFVPAIFARWARLLASIAEPGGRDRVLDVGCGTGVLAREVAHLVEDPGLVSGLDINESMLSVAGELAPAIDWRQGDAAKLPFLDDHFDIVLSQFALMFVPDRLSSLREMVRVLKPGGRLILAVWSDSAVYQSLARFCREEGLDRVAESFESFFSLADARALERLAQEAGLEAPAVETRTGTVQFPSVDDFIRVEISGWILADSISSNDYSLLRARAEQDVRAYRDADGKIAFPLNAHILTAAKSAAADPTA